MSEFRERHFKSWPALRAHYQDKARREWFGWAFRGQQSADWLLSSSLERAVVDRFQFGWTKMQRYEERTLRAFMRQAHHHVPLVPPGDDRMQWVALMQHHGAPTRLLDWTYSFYVAAFFAIENASPGEDCAIWAIDYHWLNGRLKETYPNYSAKESHLFLWNGDHHPGILPVNPFVLNQRLTIQQGCFMAVGDVKEGFFPNFRALKPLITKPALLRFTLRCDKSTLRDAIADLHRMNINRATLFPGLDGFARSLNALLPWWTR